MNSATLKKKLWGVIHFISRTEIFFYTLIWLMFLVVLGTVSQKNVGLYQAQVKYFSSFVFFVGFIPFPGAASCLIVVFVNLLAKFVFFSHWSRSFLGINIAHFGALLLLFGSFLTGALSTEGSMRIAEGQKSNIVSDYHNLEFIIRETSKLDQDTVTAFPQSFLKANAVLEHHTFPFKVRILEFYRNCTSGRRRSEFLPGAQGFLKNFWLKAKPAEKNDSQNIPCALFSVQTNSEKRGVYGVYEFMPVEQTLKVDNLTYVFEIQHEKRYLPFSLSLKNFEKKMHPGTEVPSSFSSDVVLLDDSLRQELIIQMNQPLRYQGHTFYQASFIEERTGETTILAVVQNAGRTFPYISSSIMCLGLLIHLFLQLPKLINNMEAPRVD